MEEMAVLEQPPQLKAPAPSASVVKSWTFRSSDPEGRVQDILHGIQALLDPDQAYLPSDVRILCSDGEVDFHKFVLCTQSKFFQVLFSSGVRLKAKPEAGAAAADRERKKETVDLCHFTSEGILMLKEWMYNGVLPDGLTFSKKLFEFILIGNYLMIPCIIEYCVQFYEWLVEHGAVNDKWIMAFYKIGQRLNETRLMDASVKYLEYLKFIPDHFESLEFQPFYQFVQNLNRSHKATDDKGGEQLPKTMLLAFTSGACLTALPRERFILDLIVKFLKHDKSRRLVHATALFKQLRLAFIAKEIDFVALGLEELNDRAAYEELNELLCQCAVDDDYDFYGENPKNIPASCFTPRCATVRYSLWSRRLGNFYLKLKRQQKVATPTTATSSSKRKGRVAAGKRFPPKRRRRAAAAAATAAVEGGGEEEADSDDGNEGGGDGCDDGGDEHVRGNDPVLEFKTKRFCFERGQGCRIIQIDWYPKVLTASFTGEVAKKVKNAVIAGIRLHWSDGTADVAGHVDEDNRQTCKPGDHEGLDFKECCSSDFLDRVQLYTNHPKYEIAQNNSRPKAFQFKSNTYGPFGKKEECSDGCQPMMGALVGASICCSSYSHLFHIDGLKGVELTKKDTKEKAITGIHFKFSLHLNNSLEHLLRKSKKKKGSTEDRNEDETEPAADAAESKPKSLTIRFLKAENRYLQVSDLRGAYIKQDRNLFSSDRALFVSSS